MKLQIRVWLFRSIQGVTLKPIFTTAIEATNFMSKTFNSVADATLQAIDDETCYQWTGTEFILIEM